MQSREQMLPYLANFAIPRTQTDQIGGWYSEEKAMWMLDTKAGPRPAIECDGTLIEMITKTRMQPEKDDDVFTLELLTKTEMQPERDDEIPPRRFEIF